MTHGGRRAVRMQAGFASAAACALIALTAPQLLAQQPPPAQTSADRLRTQKEELDRLRNERAELERKMKELQSTVHDLSEEKSNLK